MPNLPSLKPREVVRKFEKLGFVKDHQKGSHIIMYHSDGRRATIPFHTKDIHKGTLRTILKQSGVDTKTFLEI